MEECKEVEEASMFSEEKNQVKETKSMKVEENVNEEKTLKVEERVDDERIDDEDEVEKEEGSEDGEFEIVQYGSQEELDASMNKSQKPEEKDCWVQCDFEHCQKWRLVDAEEVPTENQAWNCSMNKNPARNGCELSQESSPSDNEVEDESVYAKYTPGQLVLAKMAGYPWWPGIIEDDPDFGSFFYFNNKEKKLLSYHVTFFGKDVSRAWVQDASITNFNGHEVIQDLGNMTFNQRNFKKRVLIALEEAKTTNDLDDEIRLKKCSFMSRYKGRNKPRKSDSNVVSDGSQERDSSQDIVDKIYALKKTQTSSKSHDSDDEDYLAIKKKRTDKKTEKFDIEKKMQVEHEKRIQAEQKQAIKEEKQRFKEERERQKTEKVIKNEKSMLKAEKNLLREEKKWLAEAKKQQREEKRVLKERKKIEREKRKRKEKETAVANRALIGQPLSRSQEHAGAMIKKYTPPEKMAVFEASLRDIDSEQQNIEAKTEVKKTKEEKKRKREDADDGKKKMKTGGESGSLDLLDELKENNESNGVVPNCEEENEVKEDVEKTSTDAVVPTFDEEMVESKPNESMSDENKTEQNKTDMEVDVACVENTSEKQANVEEKEPMESSSANEDPENVDFTNKIPMEKKKGEKKKKSNEPNEKKSKKKQSVENQKTPVGKKHDTTPQTTDKKPAKKEGFSTPTSTKKEDKFASELTSRLEQVAKEKSKNESPSVKATEPAVKPTTTAKTTTKPTQSTGDDKPAKTKPSFKAPVKKAVNKPFKPPTAVKKVDNETTNKTIVESKKNVEDVNKDEKIEVENLNQEKVEKSVVDDPLKELMEPLPMVDEPLPTVSDTDDIDLASAPKKAQPVKSTDSSPEF